MHPLANALNAYILHPTQGSEFDLVSGQRASWTNSTTPYTAGVTALGPSTHISQPASTTSTGASFALTKTSLANGTGDFTIACQIILNSRTTGDVQIFGQSNDAVSIEADVYMSGSNDLHFFADGAAINGLTAVNGVPYTIVGVRSDTTRSLYVNGAFQNSATHAAADIVTGAVARWGGWGSGFPTGGDAVYEALWTAGWNRALGVDEIAALTFDPYGLLIPAEGEMPSLFLAAAGGSFLAAWARGSNLPVIGTGNY